MLGNSQAIHAFVVSTKPNKKISTATKAPRCGTEDGPLAYSVDTPWTKKSFTWKLIDGYLPSFGIGKTRALLHESFNDWARYAPLTFREVTQNEKADFELAFVHRYHDEIRRFDGPGGNLAYAYLPPSGVIRFESEEPWTEEYTQTGFNLRIVATHEIGHALGLGHSNDRSSIMYEGYQRLQPKDILPQDDRAGIRALYGVKYPPTRIYPTTTRRPTQVWSTTRYITPTYRPRVVWWTTTYRPTTSIRRTRRYRPTITRRTTRYIPTTTRYTPVARRISTHRPTAIWRTRRHSSLTRSSTTYRPRSTRRTIRHTPPTPSTIRHTLPTRRVTRYRPETRRTIPHRPTTRRPTFMWTTTRYRPSTPRITRKIPTTTTTTKKTTTRKILTRATKTSITTRKQTTKQRRVRVVTTTWPTKTIRLSVWSLREMLSAKKPTTVIEAIRKITTTTARNRGFLTTTLKTTSQKDRKLATTTAVMKLIGREKKLTTTTTGTTRKPTTMRIERIKFATTQPLKAVMATSTQTTRATKKLTTKTTTSGGLIVRILENITTMRVTTTATAVTNFPRSKTTVLSVTTRNKVISHNKESQASQQQR